MIKNELNGLRLRVRKRLGVGGDNVHVSEDSAPGLGDAFVTRHCRILIADDDKAVAAGLQSQLEALGYEVVAIVEDGQQAIDACRRVQPDLAILDVEMPGMDGLSAASQITVEPGTPVIILSAHGHPHLVDQAVQEGVVQYLLKPITSTSLHAAIQTALGQSSVLKDLRENVADLEATLRKRKVIERAKGILMARRNITEPEAFRMLQKQSQDRRIPMDKLAEMIVQADELLERPPGSGTRPRDVEPRTPQNLQGER